MTVTENALPEVTVLEAGVPVTVKALGLTNTIVASPVTPPDWPWHVYVSAVPAVNVKVLDVGDVDKDTPWYCPVAGSDMVTPLGEQTSCMLPLSVPVAVTVTVPVMLVPVVALLVDMVVDTVDTDAKAICDMINTPTTENKTIDFWFI